MKTPIKRLTLLAILALAALLVPACIVDVPVVDETPIVEPVEKASAIQVTVGAGLASDPATKSELVVDGKIRKLKFSAGDKLYVWKNLDTPVEIGDFEVHYLAGMLEMKEGSLDPDGLSATFTGEIQAYEDVDTPVAGYPFDANPLNGSVATLIHEGTVSGTDYTIQYSGGYIIYKAIAPDVATLMTKRLSVEGSYVSGTGYKLSATKPILNCKISGLGKNQNCIYYFGYARDAFSFTSGSSYMITTDEQGAVQFAFTSNESGQHDWKLLFDQGSRVDTIALGTVNLGTNVYNVTRYVERYVPLSFEAIADGTVTFNTGGTSKPVQYSKNLVAWTDYTDAISLSAGEKVSFRGSNSSYEGCTFSCSSDCYLYGNIMSLVTDYTFCENAFSENRTLTGEKAFQGLFQGNTHIKSHASKPLELPALDLTEACYMSMFSGCTGLTTAPELNATSLANSCYRGMFSGCTGLTTAPKLIATTLESSCYKEMFSGCTGLTKVPALPAPTLVSNCYEDMFSGCISLNSITCLATTPAGATASWLENVALTGTFITPSPGNWSSGSSGIPSGWTTSEILDLSTADSGITISSDRTIKGSFSGKGYIQIADGVTVTLLGVTIEAPVECDHAAIHCLGDARIISEGASVYAGENSCWPAVYVPEGKTLTINAPDGFFAYADRVDCVGAGIGGGYDKINNLLINCGQIVIEGGSVEAYGGYQAAGIGSGYHGSCEGITINGGSVRSFGGNEGAGIGTGSFGLCPFITINGGVIYGFGNGYASGIGIGYRGNCGSISIGAGITEVTAHKGEWANNCILAGEIFIADGLLDSGERTATSYRIIKH